MAGIFHQHGRNRAKQIQGGDFRPADALPCFFNISFGKLHRGADPAGNHGCYGPVGQLVRLASGNGRNLQGIHLQAVQTPCDFQLFLKGHFPVFLAQRHIDQLQFLHRDSPFSGAAAPVSLRRPGLNEKIPETHDNMDLRDDQT